MNDLRSKKIPDVVMSRPADLAQDASLNLRRLSDALEIQMDAIRHFHSSLMRLHSLSASLSFLGHGITEALVLPVACDGKSDMGCSDDVSVQWITATPSRRSWMDSSYIIPAVCCPRDALLGSSQGMFVTASATGPGKVIYDTCLHLDVSVPAPSNEPKVAAAVSPATVAFNCHKSDGGRDLDRGAPTADDVARTGLSAAAIGRLFLGHRTQRLASAAALFDVTPEAWEDVGADLGDDDVGVSAAGIGALFLGSRGRRAKGL